jgi:hypothetical protein
MNKCPRCGSDNVGLWLAGRGNSLITYYVQCNDCSIKTNEYLYKACAIDEWDNIQMKEGKSLEID